ncbi:SpoIIE family protein phosphatase [Streptomyces sp. NPDC058206]|uniref:SpoIIE family protein phosphatase n=1 Tax=Streptomyces sp. NPDC058206 TaxID=3346382 RepID=UPI0036F12207
MIMLKDRAFPIDSLSLPPGSTLLCYTDGTTESRDATGTFYGAAARAGGASGRDSHPRYPADGRCAGGMVDVFAY